MLLANSRVRVHCALCDTGCGGQRLLALQSLCLVCLALSPHTLVVAGAAPPESAVAAAEKEAPLLAERVSRRFLLLWGRHPAPGPAQQFCACATLGGHHCFSQCPSITYAD